MLGRVFLVINVQTDADNIFISDIPICTGENPLVSCINVEWWDEYTKYKLKHSLRKAWDLMCSLKLGSLSYEILQQAVPPIQCVPHARKLCMYIMDLLSNVMIFLSMVLNASSNNLITFFIWSCFIITGFSGSAC